MTKKKKVNNNVYGWHSGIVSVTEDALINPSYDRIFVLAQAMYEGYSIEKIHSLTQIDCWFLHKLKNISDFERKLMQLHSKNSLTRSDLLEAKKLGFSDRQIAKYIRSTAHIVRNLRINMNIIPCVKQIDTVAAEFPASNNYLYLTYNGTQDDIERDSGGIVVLGSGAYCIGSSVEFDWCAVNCIKTLSKLGKKTIMINYNPETVIFFVNIITIITIIAGNM